MTGAKMHQAFADFHRVHQLVERAAARVIRTLDLPPWLEFDDLVQEGFLMVCEAVDRWDPGRARFTTYLYLHLDFFLRRAIQRQLPPQFEHRLPEEDLDGMESEDDSLHAAELRHTLGSMLGRLREESPLAFEVIAHFYGLEGRRMHSLPTIERRLGLRRGEGEQWLREGLSRLRRMWLEEPMGSSEDRSGSQGPASPHA
ncbi:RNA polymerase sigma factor RpoS [Candidatus Thermoflexus japonica]|uniref:RNA polymerase sigma factor RpoS n=1 Tax=Candidatus Thermoflexus japonica TaxID=2035417 RepID=A0A2H5Y6Q1_9CHLR|nr:RNA polymerase sigma factor RpoS [Candidatus Thermoflexus japonica]